MDLQDVSREALEPRSGARPWHAANRTLPWRDRRETLDGTCSILRTGAQWAELPQQYPPYQTGHHRLHRWVRDGTLERVLAARACDLKEGGRPDLSGRCIHSTVVVAQTVMGA